MATFNGNEDDANEDETDSTDGDDNRALLNLETTPLNYTQFKSVDKTSTWLFVRGILVETAPTLLLTIVGLTFTGELLEQVADWRAMQEVDELFILIPMLNNLKGNLEMNLSSRLSTSAILGDLDLLSTRNALVYGSLSLLQIQALLVSAIAAILSYSLGTIINPAAQSDMPKRRKRSRLRKPTNPNKTPSGAPQFVMILCTAMASASASGMVLGSFMCSLILLCRRLRRNPDNIAPPLASCLGDLLTLCILGLVSSVLIRIIKTPLPSVLVFLLFSGAGIAVWYTLRNKYVKHLVTSGWTPLFGAMIISSGTGLVLDHFVNRYEGFGLLAVAIAGLPDAVGSIFVSRLSTSLHASALQPAGHPAHDPRTFTSMTTLFVVTLPVQIVYVIFLHATGWLALPWLFVIVFVFFFSCAVLTSLSSARLLTHFLWRRGFDPDTYAMPIQSSLVDLSGQLMLVACYEVAQVLGADVKIRHVQ